MFNWMNNFTGSSHEQPNTSEESEPITFEQAAQQLDTTPEQLERLMDRVDSSAQEYQRTGIIPEEWHSLDNLVRTIRREIAAENYSRSQEGES